MLGGGRGHREILRSGTEATIYTGTTYVNSGKQCGRNLPPKDAPQLPAVARDSNRICGSGDSIHASEIGEQRPRPNYEELRVRP